MKLQFFIKQKAQRTFIRWAFLVGAGGFEPPKLKSSRFTVCPHWPLGNTPIFSFCSPWIACIYYHPDGSLSTSFAEFLDFCAESKNTKAKAAQKSTFLSGFLELVTGVEPATHWLQISCAAIAPHQHGPSGLLIEYQKTRGLSISSWRAKKQPIPQAVYYTV